MSGRIEVGCWAIIYRPTKCCGRHTAFFGIPFVVSGIYRHELGQHCPKCGSDTLEAGVTSDLFGAGKGVDISMCKRIDPPADPESTTREKELEHE